MDPDDLQKAIRLGISKVNVGTVLKRAYLQALGQFYKQRDIDHMDPHVLIGWGGEEDMISCGRAAIAKKAEEFMNLFGSAGKAPLL